jgi:hypothetical protein
VKRSEPVFRVDQIEGGWRFASVTVDADLRAPAVLGVRPVDPGTDDDVLGALTASA